ncbi:MFS transporter [Planomonospora alba]|uniref:MFS transporter n=1 Tax=Planomonospora alba TaxID=161354 RepID=A0ABP6N6D0_9ACTN
MLRNPGMLRVLRHHNYRMWAGANFMSMIGSWTQVMGVNWLLLSVSGSATSLGLGLFLQSAPGLLMTFAGGSLADRLPARPLVAAGHALHGTLAVVLAVMVFTGVDSVWPVYAVALVGGVLPSLYFPALGRFGAEVVGPDDLPDALSLGAVITSVGRVLGMGLAGVLIPVAGTGGLFVIDALGFAVVVAAICLMRGGELHPLPRAAAEDSGAVAGLRYIGRTRWLLVLLLFALVLGALSRNYQVTMTTMSQGPLQAGAAGYGTLSVVFGAGAVIGGLYAVLRRRLTFPVLFAAAALTAVGQAAGGAMPGLLPFAAVLLPVGASAVILDTTIGARLQLGTDPRMRGRVLAAQSMVTGAAGALGGPLLGVLCDALGPRAALTGAGLAASAAVCAAALAMAGALGHRLRLPAVASITAALVPPRGFRRPRRTAPVRPVRPHAARRARRPVPSRRVPAAPPARSSGPARRPRPGRHPA